METFCPKNENIVMCAVYGHTSYITTEDKSSSHVTSINRWFLVIIKSSVNSPETSLDKAFPVTTLLKPQKARKLKKQ